MTDLLEKVRTDVLLDNLLNRFNRLTLENNSLKLENNSLKADIEFCIVAGGLEINRRASDGTILSITTHCGCETEPLKDRK